MEEEKKQVGTIDLTPSWAQMLPDILTVIADSPNMRAVQDMRQELARMAVLADERNAMVEQGFPPAPVRALNEEDAATLVSILRAGAGCASDEQTALSVAISALADMVEG